MKIFVKVKTGAGESAVKQLDATHYEITTPALPVRGQANAAVIKLLAEHFNLAPSLVSIKRGHTAKQKTIEIALSQPLFNTFDIL